MKIYVNLSYWRFRTAIWYFCMSWYGLWDYIQGQKIKSHSTNLWRFSLNKFLHFNNKKTRFCPRVKDIIWNKLSKKLLSHVCFIPDCSRKNSMPGNFSGIIDNNSFFSASVPSLLRYLFKYFKSSSD